MGIQGQTLKTLYAFKGCPDAEFPQYGSLIYQNGMLYGAANYGGNCSAENGAIYVVNAKTGKEKILYSFTGKADGASPYAGLLYNSGTLYGTATEYGADDYGTLFSINAATGAETTLHSFKSNPDGNTPEGQLIYLNGILYGTTLYGGMNGYGSVSSFDLSKGKEAILDSFLGDSDAAFPVAGVTQLGNAFYGTSLGGGESGNGVIYKINLKTGGETVAYSFKGDPDARKPTFGLVYFDKMLFGTTPGGTQGTIYGFDPATGTETVLYSFTGGADGGGPQCTLVEHGGLLYGTTTYGGTAGDGTIFSFDPKTRTEKVLHSFVGGDGDSPNTGLVYGGGKFYGTTFGGGGTGGGTVFEFSPK